MDITRYAMKLFRCRRRTYNCFIHDYDVEGIFYYTQRVQLIINLKENFPHNTCQIYIKLHSKHVNITLECQIFVWKALGYDINLTSIMEEIPF